MKVSTILGAIAITASSANAFPFMAEFVRDGIITADGKIDERGLFDSINTGLNQLKGQLGNSKFDQGQVKTVYGQMQAAMAEMQGLNMPDAQLTSTPRDQLSNSSIYSAYGLDRGEGFGHTGHVWHHESADFKNYRPFPPRYGKDHPVYDGGSRSAIGDFQLPEIQGDYDNNLGWGPAENDAHPWYPPTHGQTRGPCPGLNTAANHGYLPRSGIVTPKELFIGTWRALSLSPDMCLLLGTLSFIFKGDPLRMTLSIGTNKDVYGAPMPDHIGTGIGEHGVLEGDASITRKDHTLGNVWSLDEGLYNTFLDEIEATGEVNVKSLAAGRYRAWKNTVHNNRQGDFNPWRMIVAYAESGFSHEALKGDSKVFTPQAVESWFYYERFPPGWQRRKVPVTIAEMLAWGAVVWAASPIDKSGFPTPGWSLFGLWLPIPTLGSLGKFWNILSTGGAKASIGDLACQAKGTFYDGLLSGWLRNAISDMKGTGKSGFNC